MSIALAILNNQERAVAASPMRRNGPAITPHKEAA
jgi:hypothetical protein